MREAQQPPNHTILRIIWGAFVGTLGVYAVVGYVVRQSMPQPPVPDLLPLLLPILGGVGVLLTALIFSWDHILARRADYQTYCIIRWACAEAVGIFGLVLYLLGATETIASAFLGWALLSEFRLRPVPEDYRRFQRRSGARM